MTRRVKTDFTDTLLLYRPEAIRAGAKRYFTGKPCAQGHVAPRYTKNCKCILCSADGALAWVKKSRETDVEGFRAQRRSEKHRHPINALIMASRSRAKRKGFEFTITAADLSMPEACPCCSGPLAMRTGPAKCGPTPTSPSLDRVDSSKGYVPGNIAIICWRCNELKRNSTPDELRKIIAWVEGHQEKPRLKVVGG